MLYRFLRALQQNRAQARLLYLLITFELFTLCQAATQPFGLPIFKIEIRGVSCEFCCSVLFVSVFSLVFVFITPHSLTFAVRSPQSAVRSHFAPSVAVRNTAVKRRACANGYIFWQPRSNFPRKNLKENMGNNRCHAKFTKKKLKSSEKSVKGKESR